MVRNLVAIGVIADIDQAAPIKFDLNTIWQRSLRQCLSLSHPVLEPELSERQLSLQQSVSDEPNIQAVLARSSQ